VSDTGACLVCGRSAADLDVLTAEVARLTESVGAWREYVEDAMNDVENAQYELKTLRDKLASWLYPDGEQASGGAAMTRDDVCTCGQYSQCPVCNKSRSNYAMLMAENEALTAYVRAMRHGVDRLAELELDTFIARARLDAARSAR